MARNTTKARAFWGNSPLIQKHKVLTNGMKLQGGWSGLLFTAKATVTVSISKTGDGSSFAFDARGNTITVALPAGEKTYDNKTSVTIKKVGSLTRAGGVWTYAGS